MKLIAKRIPSGEQVIVEHEDKGKWIDNDPKIGGSTKAVIWVDLFSWPRDDGNPHGMQPPMKQCIIKCPDKMINNSVVSDPLNARFNYVCEKMREFGIDLSNAVHVLDRVE